jgi:hypothetical protein
MAYVEENQDTSAHARMDRCRRQQRAKGHHLKHERRRRYAALRSEVLTVATTSGGDARRSCRIEVRSVEQELPSRTSGA